MELIKKLGLLALGSRLKLLLDDLLQDISKIYKSNDIDFESRFFLVFYLLKDNNKIRITDIAREIGISQPAVSQVTEIMAKKGLVKFIKDKKDTRTKFVYLSGKGKKIIPVLEAIWEDIIYAHEELFNSIGVDIINVLEKTENALKQKKMFERVIYNVKHRT